MGDSLDHYPYQDSYQLHLSHLLAETKGAVWRPRIKECPIARALLRCKRETQVKILLAALTRRLWQLAGRSPEDLARLYLLTDICRSILRKKLPFKNHQLEALILLVSEPTAASELGNLVLRQLKWQGPLTLCQREALTKLKRVLLHNKEFKAADRASRQLSAAQPVTSTTEAQKWRKVLAHLRRVPSKLSLRWRKRAKGLLLDFGQDVVVHRLLPWFSRNKERLLREEERFVRGLVCACGELSHPEVAKFLDEIVVWAYQHIQGRGPRAARVGHLAISALGRMATTESATYLVALESSSPYTSMQEWVQRAQHNHARYRGLSIQEWKATGLLSPDASSPLGKRLARSFHLELEQQLRSGEWIPREIWSRRAAHCALWRQLADALLWETRSKTSLGPPMTDSPEEIRLWHPAEHIQEIERWRGVKNQPFKQIDRHCFFALPQHPSPPLNQYKFGALARSRGWSCSLVGRHIASTLATINMGHTVELPVRRADPRGPFHSCGLSKHVILSPPVSKEELSARQISELTRDWRLFMTAQVKG